MLWALAEPLTMRVTAIRETEGERSARMTSQFGPGTRKVPMRKNISASTTMNMPRKESRDTAILSRKEARTLERKI